MMAREKVYLGLKAKAMKPTKAHRPAIWENMLGTVLAMNAAGKVRYFDFDYNAAKEFAELGEDLRLYKMTPELLRQGYPRVGKLVLWTK